jgi:DNA-binding SARP family transcriptional activator
MEVAVLGPVRVRGALRPFGRPGALDLVAYLALHPEGADTDRWVTALWPDRVPAGPTLHSVVSVARRALGTGPDGLDHLPRSRGRLRLRPSVGTDWAALERAAADPDPRPARRALAAVRGVPLAGLARADWAVFEGMVARMEDTVARLALRLGRAALEAGDGGEAAWAVAQGLRAAPYDERLHRLALRAADAEGNPAGVEAVMDRLLALVGEPGTGREGLEGAVHPDTASLYRSVSRRGGASGPPGARL